MSESQVVSRITEGKTIEELYNEAYACVDQGICFDEIGQRDGALAMYERGLRLIDATSQIPGCEQSEMYQKMIRAREHILFRLKDLRSGSEVPRPSSLTSLEGPPPYECITNALNAMGHTKAAEEVLLIPNGVQVFFIKGDETSVPSYPTSLKIFKFSPSTSPVTPSSSGPPAFLQVGDWVYPLVPGRSPVLHSTYGAYIFPNPSVEDPGTVLKNLVKHHVYGFSFKFSFLSYFRSLRRSNFAQRSRTCCC